MDPIAFYNHFDPLRIKVEFGVGVLLMDHVQMRLHHDRCSVFHPRTGWFAYDYVAHLVDDRLQSKTFTELFGKFDYSLLFFRRAGDCIEVSKVIPHLSGFQFAYGLTHQGLLVEKKGRNVRN